VRNLLIIVCCLFAFASQNAFAQETGRQSYIQNEIQKEELRLRSSDAEERRDAVLRLKWINTEESSRKSITALSDSAESVRAIATHAILSLPSNEAASYLLPLLNDKIEIVRQETAYALGQTRSQSAVQKLLTVLANKKELPGVRSASAIALGLIGDKQAEGFLIQALQDKKNPNPFIQRSAVRSLGQLKSVGSVALLISILNDEKAEPDVRRESANALGMIGERDAINALEKASKSFEPYLSEIANEALESLKKP